METGLLVDRLEVERGGQVCLRAVVESGLSFSIATRGAWASRAARLSTVASNSAKGTTLLAMPS